MKFLVVLFAFTVCDILSKEEAGCKFLCIFTLHCVPFFYLAFLQRSRRFVGIFEEWSQGNMERECFEEVKFTQRLTAYVD